MKGKTRNRIASRVLLAALVVFAPALWPGGEAAGQAAQPAIRCGSGGSAPGIPFEWIGQAIGLTVRVNDTLDARMIFDTGLGMQGAILLDPALGDRLGLTFTGKVNLGGGGTEGAREAGIAAGATLALPGATLSNQPLLVAKDRTPFLDWPIDGIIGGALMGCVVEIDFEQRVLNLRDRRSYTPREGAMEFPLTFSYGIPVIDAEIEIEKGRRMPVKLLVDTGAPDIPLLLFEFSDERIRPTGPTYNLVGKGMGGDMKARLGRIGSLRVGPFPLGDTVAGFVDKESFGTATALGQNGMLGNDSLERFHVAFDYEGKRLWLKPNEKYDRRYDVDMTGLTLFARRDGTYKIIDVGAGTPAAEQGLRKDDLLVAVDGKDLRKLSFPDVRRLLRREGARVGLTIQRGTERLERTVVLKRLV